MNRLFLRPSLAGLRPRVAESFLSRSACWRFQRSRSLHILVPPDLTVAEREQRRSAVIFDLGDDKDGNELRYPVEPWYKTAEQGFGFMRIDIGDCIGPNSRYEIKRKIGWSMVSSGWLAKDTLEGHFVTIIILTGYATPLAKKGLLYNLDVLNCISNREKDVTKAHCLPHHSYFIQHSTGPRSYEHFCLVTQPFGPTVEALAHDQRPSLSQVKRVLKDTLKGLAYLHDLGIAHTNVLPCAVTIHLGDFDIAEYIKRFPAQRVPINVPDDYPLIMSQPFRASELRDWQARPFVFNDVGGAQFVNKQTDDDITDVEVRAPEVIVGLPWDEKVDIWSFGCMAYNYLWDWLLFYAPKDAEEPEKHVLAHIFSITGERYPPEVIRASKRGAELLDLETGLPKGVYTPSRRSLSTLVKNMQESRDDLPLDGFDAFLQKCLRLNPKERPSAKQLLEGPWLNAD